MIEPSVQWVAPAPLWQGLSSATDAQTRAQFRQPQLLRFATDAFMDEFMALLQHQPERLGEWRARYETWQGPAAAPLPIEKLPPLVQRLHRLRLATATPLTGAGAPPSGGTALATASPATGDDRLKLYQPAHQRFYLVAACLVCRVPGLPDRTLDIGGGERVTCVMRRLRPKGGTLPAGFNLDTCDEYALVNGNTWTRAAGDALTPGEEPLPMFGVSYAAPDGRRRRVLAALVPVGRRETYLGAAAAPVLADSPPVETEDPRKAVLLRSVTDPWRSIVAQARKAVDAATADPPPGLGGAAIPDAQLDAVELAAADQATLLSWYVLLDFGDYLAKYLPKVWAVINDDAGEETLNDQEGALLARMRGAAFTDPESDVTRTLVEALVDIREWGPSLETTTTPYVRSAAGSLPPSPPFPDWRFPLHGDNLRVLVAPEAEDTPTLDDLVTDALPPDAPADTPPLPLAAHMTALDAREPGWFVIRCVFERPNCAPLTPAVVSEATPPFQMASFFDPQAPARPIRINLPLDTTAAGLRKFDKNTAFMMSDVLCGQLQRMGKLTLGDLVLSVLPWPLHKDLPTPDTGPCRDDDGLEFGMICSLSIPIITICALILLIIIVNLLDIIFRWIPFFISCFPVPRLKSKEG